MLAAASMVVPTHERVTALDRLGDEIAELSAHLDAATARLLALIREFDARGGWNTGFRSCAAWLTWRVGLDRGAARERVRVARALGTLPRLAEALARGELSYSKVRALTRVATPETETRLLAVGRAGTAEHVERIVRGWRRVDQRAEARESRRHASRGLYVRQDEDGMVMVRGRLEPEVGALLMQALAAARTVLYQRARAGAAGAPPAGPAGDPPTPAQQRADALALARGSDRPGQSALEDGTHVPAETCRRLACDASRVVMRHDAEGRVVEIGARTRTIPPALRRALQHRDGGCCFPGCGVRVGQGHHLQHWARGGPTTLSNLALLCRRHHRAVHEDGYQVARGPNGVLQFRRPDGRLLPDVPPPAAVPADPVQTLRQHHEGQGLQFTARTGCPSWLGERLDVAWAISVLHPRANRLASPS